MSTGRRLAKRSILGTRVCAPGQDGRYYPGIIQATKMNEENDGTNNQGHNVYSVLFDGGGGLEEIKTVREFIDSEIIGPGFQSVCSVKLKPGQKVYVTHNGREVYGTVICHFPQIDEVQIRVNLSSMTSAIPQQQPPPPLTPLLPPVNTNNNNVIVTTDNTMDLKKKLEEVRLLESRKSARLHDQDQDYSRLAEFGPMETRKRPTSHVIDVPTAQSNRKRRPSSPDDFDIMDNCAAAMVLMSLSCSPKSPRLPDHGLQLCHSWTDASSYLQSPSSSSGASSWVSSNQSQSTGTRTPSPPTYDCLSASAPASFPILGGSSTSALGSDEGIDVDDSSDEYVPRKRRYSNRTVFKCTWPGCEKVTRRCHDIEEHVRKTHLRKMDDLEAHEEEFYFTEIQLPTDAVTESFATMFTSSPPTLSHMDMARPPHEDPEYQKQNSPPKSVRMSPKSTSVAKTVSLHRKARGDSKKCRKVYGMDNRDLWCTQCKWKKACSRFMD